MYYHMSEPPDTTTNLSHSSLEGHTWFLVDNSPVLILTILESIIAD